jgi:hypothetical protein
MKGTFRSGLLLLAIGVQASSYSLVGGSDAEHTFARYIAVRNQHDVEGVMRFHDPNIVIKSKAGTAGANRLRQTLEWERRLSAKFDHTMVSVNDQEVVARLRPTNDLYSALDVRREEVWRYRFRNGKILEATFLEAIDHGRMWSFALSEFERWLTAKPSAATSGVLNNGKLEFTGTSAAKLGPFLSEWKAEQRRNRPIYESIMDRHIAAMNRHSVDEQYANYGVGMVYIDEGHRIAPSREDERADREFEEANHAVWSYRVLGGGLNTLEMVITEDMEYYRLLGVGPRSHRARYRFHDGKIIEAQAWDWTEKGCPYRARRDSFVVWALQNEPVQAAKVTREGRLRFERSSAASINALVSKWAKSNPCSSIKQ